MNLLDETKPKYKMKQMALYHIKKLYKIEIVARKVAKKSKKQITLTKAIFTIQPFLRKMSVFPHQIRRVKGPTQITFKFDSLYICSGPLGSFGLVQIHLLFCKIFYKDPKLKLTNELFTQLSKDKQLFLYQETICLFCIF